MSFLYKIFLNSADGMNTTHVEHQKYVVIRGRKWKCNLCVLCKLQAIYLCGIGTIHYTLHSIFKGIVYGHYMVAEKLCCGFHFFNVVYFVVIKAAQKHC